MVSFLVALAAPMVAAGQYMSYSPRDLSRAYAPVYTAPVYTHPRAPVPPYARAAGFYPEPPPQVTTSQSTATRYESAYPRAAGFYPEPPPQVTTSQSTATRYESAYPRAAGFYPDPEFSYESVYSYSQRSPNSQGSARKAPVLPAPAPAPLISESLLAEMRADNRQKVQSSIDKHKDNAKITAISRAMEKKQHIQSTITADLDSDIAMIDRQIQEAQTDMERRTAALKGDRERRQKKAEDDQKAQFAEVDQLLLVQLGNINNEGTQEIEAATQQAMLRLLSMTQ